MNKEKLINDFDHLGLLLQNYLSGVAIGHEFEVAVSQSISANPWFTVYHIHERLSSIAQSYLSKPKLQAWLAPYNDVWYDFQKEITVVMAGNIPLVGFHDYLCVLASGRRVAVKLSSKDAFLLPALHQLLCLFAPEWQSVVRFVTEVSATTDGLIVTGSDETAGWFEKSYPHLPKVVRGHRVSVAIVSEEITQVQIEALYRDMFLYFGLGCRSVVLLFVPQCFDLLRLTKIDSIPLESTHNGYRNAYLRQKALMTVKGHPFFDGGFFLLVSSNEMNPPVGTIFYSRYSCIDEVVTIILEHSSHIQCVVGEGVDIIKMITFGSAQYPQLWDYSDQIDTMKL